MKQVNPLVVAVCQTRHLFHWMEWTGCIWGGVDYATANHEGYNYVQVLRGQHAIYVLDEGVPLKNYNNGTATLKHYYGDEFAPKLHYYTKLYRKGYDRGTK